LRGATDADLVMKSVDPFYAKAAELGKLQVPFPREGIPLEVRVGRHLAAIRAVCVTLSDFNPEAAISYSRVPSYAELQEHGIGFYLQ
jgi:hypothetical protein